METFLYRSYLILWELQNVYMVIVIVNSSFISFDDNVVSYLQLLISFISSKCFFETFLVLSFNCLSLKVNSGLKASIVLDSFFDSPKMIVYFPLSSFFFLYSSCKILLSPFLYKLLFSSPATTYFPVIYFSIVFSYSSSKFVHVKLRTISSSGVDLLASPDVSTNEFFNTFSKSFKILASGFLIDSYN